MYKTVTNFFAPESSTNNHKYVIKLKVIKKHKTKFIVYFFGDLYPNRIV